MFFTPERIALLICLVGGYCFGLIQTGYFIAKGQKVDIKHLGSKNTGATNIWRVMGPGWGILTFICDVAKVVAAILIAKAVMLNVLHYDIPVMLIYLYTGLGVVLGHDFPAYLKFRGGKGIACSFAIFVCFWEPQYVIVGAVIFFLVFIISRYVSLSSIVTMIVELITFLICTLLNITYIPKAWLVDCNVIMILLVVLAIFTHRQNIVRLFLSEEPKFRFRNNNLSEYEEGYYDNEFLDEDDEEYDEEVEEQEDVKEVEEIKEATEEVTEVESKESSEETTEEVIEETEEVTETVEEATEELTEEPKEETEEVSEEIQEETEETTEEVEEEKEKTSLPRVVNVVLSKYKEFNE